MLPPQRVLQKMTYADGRRICSLFGSKSFGEMIVVMHASFIFGCCRGREQGQDALIPFSAFLHVSSVTGLFLCSNHTRWRYSSLPIRVLW
mmetsp:Transcript_9883/g.26973  ORF Transcript_9883/g.26973 Transcript_9883/m.26973 type:complete len:90 (-) Transcript_9883:1095-1364(-)